MEQENETLEELGQADGETNAPALFDDHDDDLLGDEGGTDGSEGAEGSEQNAVEAEDEDLDVKNTRRFADMRKKWNGTLKDKRRLERELEELRAKVAPPAPTVKAKPTLDQYDYDEERFSAAYDEWMADKSKVEAIERTKREEAQREEQTVEEFKKSYAARAKALGVDDFEDAENEIRTMLNPTQVGLMLKATDDPAALVYALSKSPGRLIELSKISDPVKFTAASVRMEIALATKKTPRPAPEARITGERTSAGSSVGSSHLDKLRSEAERTGDYSKVVAYKRKNAQQ